MNVYNLKYNAKAPRGIEGRHSYIIGGGRPKKSPEGSDNYPEGYEENPKGLGENPN